MPFDPFRRFRLRSRPPEVTPSPNEEDSEESSPERDQPHIIHVPKNDRKSHERLFSSKCSAKDITLVLDKSHERPSKKSPTPGTASVACPPDVVDALQPVAKPTLIRRVTSKLNIISIPSRSSGAQNLRSRPSARTLAGDTGPCSHGPRLPRTAIVASPTLPNSFVSKEHREAALRERGLLPPRKDLSEQEREADRRLGCVPPPASQASDGSTEAERFKARWLAASGCGDLESARSSPSPIPPPDADIARRSGEWKVDLPHAGRPSFCSSVPPLSTSSYLEVLHEEPSEQGPITPPPPLSPARLPIIVSSSAESPPSPTLAESPTSCTFSSHCPGSTLESHSQASHPPLFEKENIRLSSHRRTSDSGDRPRKVVGSSLSKFGTHSLTNLRRSVAGSLRAPSSSTLSTTDHSFLLPRTAIDPTMHSLGSILRETRDIKDAESRRLSELAFLD